MPLQGLEVAAITVICLLIGQFLKGVKFKNTDLIPVICGLMGGILGLLGMNLISDFPAHDPITAIAIGILSGLAATGLFEVYHQLRS